MTDLWRLTAHEAHEGLRSRAFTAVEPIATMSPGCTTSISASSQGLQARISLIRGVTWMRRLPRGSNLKCLTALVT